MKQMKYFLLPNKLVQEENVQSIKIKASDKGGDSQNKEKKGTLLLHKKNAKRELMQKHVFSSSEQGPKENTIRNPLVSGDEELNKYWEELSVKEEFKLRFANKLNYFDEKIQKELIAKEKNDLKKAKNIYLEIIAESSKRDKFLSDLKNWDLMIQGDKRKATQGEVIRRTRELLSNIKVSHVNLATNVNTFLKQNPNSSDKFNLKTMPCKEKLKEDFFLNLNEGLKFLHDGLLGQKLGIKNNFDPLLLDFEDDFNIDSNKIINACVSLFNNFILTNYNVSNKKVGKNIRLKKTEKINVEANNNLNNNFHKIPISHKKLRGDEKSNGEEKEKLIIDCKNKEKEEDFSQNDRQINKLASNKHSKLNIFGNKSKIEEEKSNKNNVNCYLTKKYKIKLAPETTEQCRSLRENLTFYKGKIDDLAEKYSDYYEKIPENQKITFQPLKNLDENLMSGIHPMIIVEFDNKTTASNNHEKMLCSFVHLSFSPEKEGILLINSLSTLKNPQILFENLLSFLEEKRVKYKYLMSNLYHQFKEDNKSYVDDYFNKLYKALKFRWMVLENDDEKKIRYQKMRYTNQNCNVREGDLEYNCPIVVKCASVITINKGNKDNNINYIKSINKFNCKFIQYIHREDKEKLQKIINAIDENFAYGKEQDKNRLINIVNDHKFNIDFDRISFKKLDNNDYYYSIYTIKPIFESFSFTKIHGKKYMRISGQIEVLTAPEIEQNFYMVLSQNSYALIIAEVNDKLKRKLNDESVDLSSYFLDLYNTLEQHNDPKITSIYIPEFDKESTEEGAPGEDIINESNYAFNYVKFYSNKKYTENDVKFSIGDCDLIIKNQFLLSVLNVELDEDVSNLGCEVIDVNNN